MAKREAIKRISGDAPYDFRSTLGHYRIPIIVGAFGTILSLASFAFALNFQMDTIQKDFIQSARQQTTLIDERLYALQERMYSAASLIGATDPPDEIIFRRYVTTMMGRLPFEAFGWRPLKDTEKNEFYVTSNNMDMKEVMALPPLRNALRAEQDHGGFIVSAPFTYEKNAGPYIAPFAPVKKNGDTYGTVISLITLRQISASRILTLPPFEERRYIISLKISNCGLIIWRLIKGQECVSLTY